MAVGDGGFKQVPFGFDKNEVNEYISDLLKKSKAMESEVKASVRKAEEATKLAEQADNRIAAAVKEVQDKADEIRKQLDAANDKNEKLENTIKEVRAELENERKKMSDMLMSGKGVSAEAQKVYTEIIDKANNDAKSIIADADAKADEIVAAARERCSDVTNKTNGFLELLKAQIEAFSEGYKAVAESASVMLGADVAPAPAVELPAVSEPVTAPETRVEPTAVAVAVAETADFEPVAETVVSETEPSSDDNDALMAMLKSAEEAAEAASAVSEPEPVAEPASDELASFDEVWGGSEIAETVVEEAKETVPLVNPDFDSDVFGFGNAADDLTNDLSAGFDEPAQEEKIEAVTPLDMSEHSEAAFDHSFDSDLISQTMSSASLGNDISEDLLATIKAAEESFAVKPNNPDFDMDMDGSDTAMSSEDELMKALRDAEAAMGGMTGTFGADIAEEEPIAASSSGGNDWADLESQLAAMEQAGFGGDILDETPTEAPVTAASADPTAPSADDAAIWNFGGGSDSSDDDDMSSDFGGFGGF